MPWEQLGPTPVRRAGNGRQGEGSNRTGADATDLVIPVPNGTEVKTADGEVLADLIGVGTRFVAVGQGGLVAYSDDASNWLTTSSGSASDLAAVIFTPAMYLAVGASGANAVSK